jgi:uncharacterized protein
MQRDLVSRRDLLRGSAAVIGVAAATAAPQNKRVPVIDCHAHAGHAPELTDPWTAIASPEEILKRNAEAGIDQSVIFPISQETFARANQEIADICRRYAGKFIGYAKHDPDNERGKIRQMLLHECHDLGLRGLKLHKRPGPEILDVVAELGIPIIYHPGSVSLFYDIARNYPTVDFILAHLGSDLSNDWREHIAAIELARAYPNVYLDTGAVMLTRYIEQAVEQLGPAKIIFGSDEPEVDCRLEIYKIRMLKLGKEDEQMILGGNIARLLSKYRGMKGGVQS